MKKEAKNTILTQLQKKRYKTSAESFIKGASVFLQQYHKTITSIIDLQQIKRKYVVGFKQKEVQEKQQDEEKKKIQNKKSSFISNFKHILIIGGVTLASFFIFKSKIQGIFKEQTDKLGVFSKTFSKPIQYLLNFDRMITQQTGHSILSQMGSFIFDGFSSAVSKMASGFSYGLNLFLNSQVSFQDGKRQCLPVRIVNQTANLVMADISEKSNLLKVLQHFGFSLGVSVFKRPKLVDYFKYGPGATSQMTKLLDQMQTTLKNEESMIRYFKINGVNIQTTGIGQGQGEGKAVRDILQERYAGIVQTVGKQYARRGNMYYGARQNLLPQFGELKKVIIDECDRLFQITNEGLKLADLSDKDISELRTRVDLSGGQMFNIGFGYNSIAPSHLSQGVGQIVRLFILKMATLNYARNTQTHRMLVQQFVSRRKKFHIIKGHNIGYYSLSPEDISFFVYGYSILVVLQQQLKTSHLFNQSINLHDSLIDARNSVLKTYYDIIKISNTSNHQNRIQKIQNTFIKGQYNGEWYIKNVTKELELYYQLMSGIIDNKNVNNSKLFVEYNNILNDNQLDTGKHALVSTATMRNFNQLKDNFRKLITNGSVNFGLEKVRRTYWEKLRPEEKKNTSKRFNVSVMNYTPTGQIESGVTLTNNGESSKKLYQGIIIGYNASKRQMLNLRKQRRMLLEQISNNGYMLYDGQGTIKNTGHTFDGFDSIEAARQKNPQWLVNVTKVSVKSKSIMTVKNEYDKKLKQMPTIGQSDQEYGDIYYKSGFYKK